MLKRVLESLDGLDKAFHSLYTKKADGKFYLDVEPEDGDVAGLKTALESERSEKKKLNERLAKLLEEVERYKDLDPAKAREALKKIQKLEDKKLLDEGQIEQLLEKRMGAAKSDWESQTKALTAKLKELEEGLTAKERELATHVIDNSIARAAGADIAHTEALSDLQFRGRNVFKVENGQPVAYDPHGEPIWGKDPSKKLSIAEWVEQQKKSTPYLFKGSFGGGAHPGSGKDGQGRYTITESESKDFKRYEAVKAEAAKEGQQVTIVPDRE